MRYGEIYQGRHMPLNSSCNEIKAKKKKIAYGTKNAVQIDNGSLGFTEILNKQYRCLQHCLRPLAYTWADREIHQDRHMPLNSSCNEIKAKKKKIAYGTKNIVQIENGSLGFTEILYKQYRWLQHCLRPLAYTWADREIHQDRHVPLNSSCNEIKAKTKRLPMEQRTQYR